MLLHHKSVILLLWITAAFTAPVALSTDHVMTLQAGILLFIGGIAHSTVAPLLYFSALRKVLAQHAAVLGYIEPLAAVPFAMVFLAEVPSSLSLSGGILILASGYIIIHASAHNSNSE
jgi:drug/metabolite transporter (DMT)-like permease